VRVIERHDRLDGRHLSSLLYRIATNLCLNRIRDGKRRPEDADDERLHRIAGAERPGAESDARLLLDRIFGRHPESSRTMAVLHYIDGLTLEDVAEQTGMSVSGVRKRLRKLRETSKEIER
jgi:RNA polymerase sigma-70 factor (ECF subfamily)